MKIELTLKHLYKGIDTYLNEQSKKRLITVGFAFTLLLGVLDYITGSELRIDVFYLIPILFVAWYVGEKASIFILTLSVLLIFFSDYLLKPNHSVNFNDLWNLTMVLLFFIIVTKLRSSFYEQRQLSLKLQKALDDIKTTNESLEAFSYSVSHDLRNPLNRILGFSDVLLEGYSDKLDDEGKNYLNRVIKNAVRMNLIMDDLLHLSRISRHGLQRQDVDLSKIAASIVAELREAQPDRNAAIDIQEGITAFSDAKLIEVALSNLLGNAWKFTSKIENAKIEFGTFKREGKVIYYVKDNGAGFDQSFSEKLFLPFQRLHSEEEFEGTGIGLATVQRIVHRHGGEVWAEGEPGKGAIFYFTLQ
jgi:signal transduction histidine kinase